MGAECSCEGSAGRKTEEGRTDLEVVDASVEPVWVEGESGVRGGKPPYEASWRRHR